MKRIGIIGGLGPEATQDYYKHITAYFHQYNQSLSTPEIIIYSVDIAELFELVSAKRWESLVDWLVSKLLALKNAGADFAAISANTPHIVFDQLLPRSPLPLISIVEATLQSAQRCRFKKVGLLGTAFTMQASFFRDPFSRAGISLVVPEMEEQAYIQDCLVQEIELGVFKEETRQGLISIIEKMKKRDGIEAVILGCTELPLILDPNCSALPLLNTSALHVEAICQYVLQSGALEKG